jgi:hypothetical protein
MRPLGRIVALSVSALLCLPFGPALQKKPIIVNGPTVIAFFPSVTDAELSKASDTNEALADFQLYSTRVRPRLNDAGIHFEEVYASSFAIRCATKTTTFRPQKGHVGYYFIAPGKPPHIEYGVLTDVDIVQAAAAYFQLALK